VANVNERQPKQSEGKHGYTDGSSLYETHTTADKVLSFPVFS